MTVSDIINILSKYNPNTNVRIEDSTGKNYTFRFGECTTDRLAFNELPQTEVVIHLDYTYYI